MRRHDKARERLADQYDKADMRVRACVRTRLCCGGTAVPAFQAAAARQAAGRQPHYRPRLLAAQAVGAACLGPAAPTLALGLPAFVHSTGLPTLASGPTVPCILSQVEKHWTEKALEDMAERDWRIFREDFNIGYMGVNRVCHPLLGRAGGHAHAAWPPAVGADVT
jgi:hypothetical protein